MTDLIPIEISEPSESERAWMLERLDFMRSLVESGAGFYVADGPLGGASGVRLNECRIVFTEAAWAAHRGTLPAKPRPVRPSGHIGPPRGR